MLCAVPWWANGLAIIFVAVCVLLVLLVLLQKGRGGGLASAFGGEGGQSAFGSKTGDVFTWITIGVVVTFGLLAIILAKYYKPAEMEENVNTGSNVVAPQDLPAAEPTDAAPAENAGDVTAPTATPVDAAAQAAETATQVVETATDAATQAVETGSEAAQPVNN
ncbi:MAG: preprotein translocase subunit SecG [Sedimentisphaerales bacterium]|nr:preprotein translocase subunit SecG [Sedimentisphaerales bacterium]